MIKFDSKHYYQKTFTKGTYKNHDFIICDENGEVFVTFLNYMEVDSSEHHGILDKIKKDYLKLKRK